MINGNELIEHLKKEQNSIWAWKEQNGSYKDSWLSPRNDKPDRNS